MARSLNLEGNGKLVQPMDIALQGVGERASSPPTSSTPAQQSPAAVLLLFLSSFHFIHSISHLTTIMHVQPAAIATLYTSLAASLLGCVGAIDPECPPDELLAHACTLLHINDAQHAAAVTEAKVLLRVCHPRLRVNVLRGKGLAAKDANGKSDPYCVLQLLHHDGALCGWMGLVWSGVECACG